LPGPVGRHAAKEIHTAMARVEAQIAGRAGMGKANEGEVGGQEPRWGLDGMGCDWKWVRTGNWTHGQNRSEINNPSKLRSKNRLFASLRLGVLASSRLRVFALNGRGVPPGDELKTQAWPEKWGPKPYTVGPIEP